MVGPVNNSTQQILVNPFQQRQETGINGENKKPQENRTQPRQAAAAGTQFTDTRDTNRREEAQGSKGNSFNPARQGASARGSLFDTTV